MPKERHFQAQNAGAARVFSGIVNEGLVADNWRITCSNGATINIPKHLFPHLKHDDQPSIVLGFIVTALVETDPLARAN